MFVVVVVVGVQVVVADASAGSAASAPDLAPLLNGLQITLNGLINLV